MLYLKGFLLVGEEIEGGFMSFYDLECSYFYVRKELGFFDAKGAQKLNIRAVQGEFSKMEYF